MKRISSLLTCLLVALTLAAVPARPGFFLYTEPDGTARWVQLRGDEHFHWLEDAAGGRWLADEAGFLQAVDAGEFAEKARAARVRRQISTDASLQVTGSFPTKGKRRLLMLLVNYSDTTPLYSQEDFVRLMNEEAYGGIGSFRDYYLQQSYGALDIEVTVTPWIQLFYPKSYYGSEGAVAMITEALQSLPDTISLADFDNDGDGILDGLAVIHQGLGYETSGASGDIWSHSSEIYGFSRDGVTLRRYTIEPELSHGTVMTHIGVLCHEFGHNLGAPDFYDTDYGTADVDYFAGTGTYDLMASGAWNGETHYGERPAGINAWQKVQFGWVEPTTLSESQGVTVQPANEEPQVLVVETTVPGEYFVMENRQQHGAFDKALPGAGLIVYHVDEALIRKSVTPNTLNAAFPQALYIVSANAPSDPDGTVKAYGDPNQASTPFPGTLGKTELSDATLPSLRSTTGRLTYAAVQNITQNADGTVSLDFVKQPTPDAVSHLTAAAQRGVVSLSWTLDTDADVDHFNLYRNDTLLATLTDCGFEDVAAPAGILLTYAVDVTYRDGLTSPYVSVQTRVPARHITGVLSEIADDGTVTLRPQLPTSLTRLETTDLTTFNVAEYDVDEADFAARFSAQDLTLYKGCRITRLTFLPVQAPSEVRYTACVWETKADGTETLLSETPIEEFAIAGVKEVVLSKPVTIVSGRSYRIGLHATSTVGSCQILTVPSGIVVPGANCVRLSTGDGTWQTESQTAGNLYLVATLTLATPSKVVEFVGNDDASDFDATTDLCYPVGFRIQRDGVDIGTCSSCVFIDPSPLPSFGAYTYTVTSLYPAGNEAAPLEVSVLYGTVDAIAAPVSASEPGTPAAEDFTPDGRRATATSPIVVSRAGKWLRRR